MVKSKGPEPPLFGDIKFYITKSDKFSTLKTLDFPQEFEAQLIGYKRHGTLLVAFNYNGHSYFMPSSECSPLDYAITPQKLQNKLKRSVKRVLITKYIEYLRGSEVRVIPKISKIKDGRIPKDLQSEWIGELIGYIHKGDTIYYQVSGEDKDKVRELSSMHFIIEAPPIEKEVFDKLTTEKAQKDTVKKKKVLTTLNELADFLDKRFNVDEDKGYDINLIDHIAVLKVSKGDIEATINRSLIVKKATNPFFRETLIQAIQDFRKLHARRKKHAKRFLPPRGRGFNHFRRR